MSSSEPGEVPRANTAPPEGSSREAPRVGYLGPAGTFSEEALLASARPGSIEPVALPSIYETVAALRRGEVELAVVPIENSLDGSVTVTLDLLAETDQPLEIVGEALLGIRHSLIAGQPLELSAIKTVISHPKVPGQCTRFLRSELAHAQILPASSTAEAVRAVTGQGANATAALGTRLAAEIYGGTVLREDVQDRDDNETRFVWLALAAQTRAPAPLRTQGGGEQGEVKQHKTSLVFWGAGAEHPGWLVRCLDEFARRAINLTKIESRPRRASMGSYMFFVDLEDGLHAAAVAEAVGGLRELCEAVRVLGSYRAA